MLLVVAGGGGVTEGMELRGGAAPPPPPPPPAVRLGWSVPTAEDKVVTARERDREMVSSASTHPPWEKLWSAPACHPANSLSRTQTFLPPSQTDSSHNNRSNNHCHLLNLCPGPGMHWLSAYHVLNHSDMYKKWGAQETQPTAPSRSQRFGMGCRQGRKG